VFICGVNGTPTFFINGARFDGDWGIKHEILGQLTRATINTTNDYELFASVPYQPYYCPVCETTLVQKDTQR